MTLYKVFKGTYRNEVSYNAKMFICDPRIEPIRFMWHLIREEKIFVCVIAYEIKKREDG